MKPTPRLSAILARNKTNPGGERLFIGLGGLAAVLILQLFNAWFH